MKFFISYQFITPKKQNFFTPMVTLVAQTQTHHFPNYQKQWLLEMERQILDQLNNSNLRVADIAFSLGMSERQLYRRIKKVLGTTPNMLLQHLRLEMAKEHLKNGNYRTVAEVSFAVGYNCPNYFSNIFTKKYKKKPKAYITEFKF